MHILAMVLAAGVLSPWTPVRTDGTKVSVVGRDYIFADAAMPVAMNVSGNDILAGPIRIAVCGTNGAEAVWNSGGSWVESSDDESATICAWQSSDVAIADVIARVEFDGMAKVTLTVLPQQSQPVLSISKVWLEIPLKPEFATLRATYPRTWGKVENAGGVHGALAWPFKPSVWLGNEDLGICWFCESNERFANIDPDRVVEVLPGEKETVLRIRFADHFVRKLPMSWTFGLQLTPVKPFDRSWNANYVFHGMKATADDGSIEDVWPALLRDNPVKRFMPQIEMAKKAGAKTVVFHEGWIRIQNNPASASPAFKDVVKACHDNGLKVLVYLGYEISALDPLWQKYGESVINYDGTPNFVPVLWCRKPAQRDFPVCYASAFAADWLERAKKAYVDLGIDGYYLDGTIMPTICMNEMHGCGWTGPDGVRRNTYCIFAVREMMKELYRFVHEHGGVVNAHQSGCVCSATLSMCDSYWDGEHLAYTQGDIKGQLDLEVFRAEFMGRNHGVPCEFLSTEKAGRWTHDDAFAITLIHDVLPRAHSLDTLRYFPERWKALADFGVTEAEFRPYWKTPVAVSPETVKASVYEKPAASLVVVSNLGRESTVAEVRLPEGRSSASDAVTGEKFAVSGGVAKVALDSFRCRLVLAK